jgi:hypothetical protein
VDDLADLVTYFNLTNGHSTGGGEVARYVGGNGTRRVAKTLLIGAVPPATAKKRVTLAPPPFKRGRGMAAWLGLVPRQNAGCLASDICAGPDPRHPCGAAVS